MKAETARLLRAVLRLIEDDVSEWKDAVVEIDEREAAHWQRIAVSTTHTDDAVADLHRKLDSLRTRVDALGDEFLGHIRTYDAHPTNYSRRVPS